MSMFKRIFKSANKENEPSTTEAIQKLKQTEEMLEKKQEYLEKKIDTENTVAKKYAKTNKSRDRAASFRVGGLKKNA